MRVVVHRAYDKVTLGYDRAHDMKSVTTYYTAGILFAQIASQTLPAKLNEAGRIATVTTHRIIVVTTLSALTESVAARHGTVIA